jgi:hypothetical protein
MREEENNVTKLAKVFGTKRTNEVIEVAETFGDDDHVVFDLRVLLGEGGVDCDL